MKVLSENGYGKIQFIIGEFPLIFKWALIPLNLPQSNWILPYPHSVSTIIEKWYFTLNYYRNDGLFPVPQRECKTCLCNFIIIMLCEGATVQKVKCVLFNTYFNIENFNWNFDMTKSCHCTYKCWINFASCLFVSTIDHITIYHC